MHGFVEIPSQGVNGSSPRSYFHQVQRGITRKRHRIEILMCDCVSPVDQFLKQLASPLVPGI
jgi:hypothetical protein